MAPNPINNAKGPKNGKSMVLIYRTRGMVGAASWPFVWINGRKLNVGIGRGDFYSCEATPGAFKAEFSWKDRYLGANDYANAADRGYMKGGASPGGGLLLAGIEMGVTAAMDTIGHDKVGVNINVSPNRTYYIQMNGGTLGDIKQVPESLGEKGIQDCNWLNPAEKSASPSS